MGANSIGYGRKTIANKAQAVNLPSGGAYLLPSGQYMVQPGPLSFLQWFDPVSNTWRNASAGFNEAPMAVFSDGSNYRVANMSGTVVGAVVTNGGTGYTNGIYYPSGFPINNPNAVVGAGTAAAPTCTFAAGGGGVLAQGNVIVGGSINTTVTITTAGSGYTRAPTLVVSPPPPGGIQATMDCTISAGAINAVTVRSEGAGYTSAPTVTVVNHPDDSAGSGAVLTVNATLTNSGKIIGITMASFGAGHTSVPAITFAPASTTAATAVMCFTATTVTWSTPSNAGNGNFGLINSTITAGTEISVHPEFSTGFFKPRMGFTAMSTSATPTTTTITDGGLHQVVPNAVLVYNSNGTISAATTTTIAQGGAVDVSYIVPL